MEGREGKGERERKESERRGGGRRGGKGERENAKLEATCVSLFPKGARKTKGALWWWSSPLRYI